MYLAYVAIVPKLSAITGITACFIVPQPITGSIANLLAKIYCSSVANTNEGSTIPMIAKNITR